MPPNTNGWPEWSRYVLKELERLNDCYEKLQENYTEFKEDFVALQTEFKIKAGVWGLLGGLIPVVIGLGYLILKGR